MPTTLARLATATASVLALAPIHAHATQVFCADSVPEISAALAAADDDPVELRVVRGTYNLSGSCMDLLSACTGDEDLVIRGGYAPGCGSRTTDPADTVFTRPGGGLLIDNGRSALEGAGDITLESLTFRNVTAGVRLVAENFNTPDQRVRLLRVWGDQAQITVQQTSVVEVRNSLFTRSPGCGLRILDAEQAQFMVGGYLEQVAIAHSTFAGNTGDGLCVGDSGFGWRITLENSIAWGNGGEDVRFVQGAGVPVIGATEVDATLRNNLWSAFQSNLPLARPADGTLTTDPRFIDPAGLDYELANASPAVNSGKTLSNSAVDRDLKGDARWFGDRPDRGALESPVGSSATVITVTNTNDTGAGSLRQALVDANALPNFNRIQFAIGSTCGPRTINLDAALPDITGPVLIDGYSQPGSARNTAAVGNNRTLCVILAGRSGLGTLSGLLVPTSASDATSLRVEGLAFSNFSIAAVTLSGGSDHSIQGAQFGGTLGAATLLPVGNGVRVGAAMDGVTIGGLQPDDRNTFADATIAAISIAGSFGDQPSNVLVQNNYIGTTTTGGAGAPNQRGIIIRGFNNTVRDNVISYNLDDGILVDGSAATGNVVEDNRIGAPTLCLFPPCVGAGNGGHGVLIANGARRNLVRGNLISDNGGDGVAVVGANDNALQGNEMLDNTGEGIDLGDDGYTANDNDSVPPPATRGNRGLNAPVITRAGGSAADGMIDGRLVSTNGTYSIDVFADDTCPAPVAAATGQGRYYLGRFVVTISNAAPGVDGTATFTGVPIARAGDPDFFLQPRRILATATRGISGGTTLTDTSEHARCIAYDRDPVFASGFE
jgi:parallel beta-helix repeat protein